MIWYNAPMNLTVERTPNGVKIPLTAFTGTERLEVVIEDEYALVRSVPEEGNRFAVDPRHEQMEREVAAFEAQHATLSQTHLGQYVAFHNGELVGVDSDPQALRKRVREHYGRHAVVMIQQVELTLPPPLRLGSMRKARD